MTREETIAQLYSLVAQPNAATDAAETVRNDVAQLTAPLFGSAVDSGTANPASAAGSQLGNQLALLTQQLDLLRAVQQAQVDAVTENTSTLAAGAASRIASTAASVATNAISGGGFGGGGLLGGFGLSPIVGGLLKLFGFGGGDSGAQADPLVRYSAPSAIGIDAGIVNGQLTEVSRGAGDRLRTMSAPQVTVQVNALDTQSFLDRSDDIARAVRQAMLESHPINDVVADL